MRVAIGDMKLPENEATSTRGVPPFLTDEKAVNDYYPFGMTIADRSYSTASYRYGYNGKENDNEVKGTGNSVDFGERIYDPRVAKFLSIDPLVNKFPNQSGYLYAGDSPIFSIDENGLFKKIVNYYEDEKGNQTVLRVDIDNSAKYDCYLIKGMFRVKPNTVEYVRWDAHSKKISSSGDLPLTNIGDTRYVGPWNPPDLGPNRPDHRYPPLNSLDKAALKHDKAYDKKQARGFEGMMMNTDVIDADIELVKSSIEVVKLFVTGQNDPVTKTRVDAIQATAAVGVALLFLDMVEQKALRIGGDKMLNMVKDLSREVTSAVKELKDVVNEVNNSLNSSKK